jgi:hypothetical protein
MLRSIKLTQSRSKWMEGLLYAEEHCSGGRSGGRGGVDPVDMLADAAAVGHLDEEWSSGFHQGVQDYIDHLEHRLGSVLQEDSRL